MPPEADAAYATEAIVGWQAIETTRPPASLLPDQYSLRTGLPPTNVQAMVETAAVAGSIA